MRALATLEDPAKFGPWLCGIASRVCLDWLKSSQARQVSLDAMSDGQADAWIARESESPDEAAARADDEQWLLAEVARLPETYREVILLYYYDDVTYQDVAAAGMNPLEHYLRFGYTEGRLSFGDGAWAGV